MIVPDWETLMRCRLPENTVGQFAIKKFTVSEEDAFGFNLRQMFQQRPERKIEAGDYTKLVEGDAVWMSDTPAEVRDHIPALQNARGLCFITGLGLGCVTQGMLEKTEPDGTFPVEKVIVLEINPEVIQLVGVPLMERYGDRLEIRNEDALQYDPPRKERYQCVWHDIWKDISVDNYDDMKRLAKKYNARSRWSGVWCKDTIYKLRRKH